MLPYKTRKRLSYLILIVGVPLYIVVAVTLVNWIERTWGRPPIWAEFVVYVGLGFLWMLPLKPIFKGVGQADPDDQSGRK